MSATNSNSSFLYLPLALSKPIIFLTIPPYCAMTDGPSDSHKTLQQGNYRVSNINTANTVHSTCQYMSFRAKELFWFGVQIGIAIVDVFCHNELPVAQSVRALVLGWKPATYARSRSEPKVAGSSWLNVEIPAWKNFLQESSHRIIVKHYGSIFYVGLINNIYIDIVIT